MERGEKLTFQAIWRDPGEMYVLWPRGEFWDVRYKQVRHGKLEWKPIADKLFSGENEAWQFAYEYSLNKKRMMYILILNNCMSS
ncbi:hypothetical protein HA51_12635 [Pantoea rwandensis]|uniref:Uncharacterized protein n=1 Tax=Pantoea rwandensis TaxID=1076550 RepID=A0A1X1CXF9_9GAMM|nr:hypothetical protein HA51_12635 [Pantoea rwandensis]